MGEQSRGGRQEKGQVIAPGRDQSSMNHARIVSKTSMIRQAAPRREGAANHRYYGEVDMPQRPGEMGYLTYNMAYVVTGSG